MNANEIDIHMHRLMLLILRCKNSTERATLVFGTLRRQDTGDLQAAATRCIRAGLVQFGTDNASARAYSTRYAPVESLLYLTKAGKAYLRAQGSDFGSGKVSAEMSRLARAAFAAKQPKVSVAVTPAFFAQSVGVA